MDVFRALKLSRDRHRAGDGQRERACPECGERCEAIRDPDGRWSVCTRCGWWTDLEEEKR